MNERHSHLDLDTWIVPGQIRKANLCRGLGNRYTPAGTEVLISAVAHNTPHIYIYVYTHTHILIYIPHNRPMTGAIRTPVFKGDNYWRCCRAQ